MRHRVAQSEEEQHQERRAADGHARGGVAASSQAGAQGGDRKDRTDPVQPEQAAVDRGRVGVERPHADQPHAHEHAGTHTPRSGPPPQRTGEGVDDGCCGFVEESAGTSAKHPCSDPSREPDVRGPGPQEPKPAADGHQDHREADGGQRPDGVAQHGYLTCSGCSTGGDTWVRCGPVHRGDTGADGDHDDQSGSHLQGPAGELAVVEQGCKHGEHAEADGVDQPPPGVARVVEIRTGTVVAAVPSGPGHDLSVWPDGFHQSAARDCGGDQQHGGDQRRTRPPEPAPDNDPQDRTAGAATTAAAR